MALRTRVLASIAAVALGSATVGCASETTSDPSGATQPGLVTVKPGTLTVCSASEPAPVAFNTSVISAVARKLSLKVVLVATDPGSRNLATDLKGRRCDLGAGALTITSDPQVLFTDGYYAEKQSLLVSTGSPIAGLADLRGKKVGVLTSSAGATYLREHAKTAVAVAMADQRQLYAALKSGSVSAVIEDLPVNLAHQNDPAQLGRFTVVETYDTGDEYGFAAAPGNHALIASVNSALAAITADGEYQKIYDQYYSAN